MVGVKIGFKASDCRGRNFHGENRGLGGLSLRKCTSLNCRKIGGNNYFRKGQTQNFVIQQ